MNPDKMDILGEAVNYRVMNHDLSKYKSERSFKCALMQSIGGNALSDKKVTIDHR